MKPFFVGQRVRVIRSPTHPSNVGQTGTVMSELHPHTCPVWAAAGVHVHAVDLPDAEHPGEGLAWCFEPHEIEPVDSDPAAAWSRLRAVLDYRPRMPEVA